MFKTFISSFNTNNLLNVAKSLRSKYCEQVLYIQANSISRWKRSSKMTRTWERAMGGAGKGTSGGSKVYTLLSYNILAQDLLVEHLHLYMGIEPSMLRWDHRLLRLTEEIQHIKPDILCLQEMQFNHIRNFVKHISFKRQLEYVFKKKTGHRTDGCAIIYDKNKFRLLADLPVEYYTKGHAILNRDNVALLAMFSVRNEPSKKFIVATTHLLYNPKRQDVRIAQVEKLIAALQQFSVENENGKSVPLPVILTGDFNFEPKTRPYQILCEQCKDPPICERFNKHDEGSGSNQEASKEYYLKTPKGNNLQMAPIDFGMHTASTFQERWITVDYILQSVDENRQKIQIQSAYTLPKINDCIRTGLIPNKHLGSDHYSLGIQFSVL
ncbi:protein angel [Ceratitis capitata]|uniref:(Mediterranean fruit fly) hypothetical protein n=1 Tax=Ceratitis capitata TaxID=7213 RepID=W8BWV4_CERCA|nr:protein angel [Ceratitis capitata]CAD7015407.1 unnamed protein product [Ceratitis capitata]